MTRTVPASASLDGRTRERLDELLTGSSRTFALTIPLLPEPTRLEVTLAYLLFRVADTLEDATRWSARRKQDELEALAQLLESPGASSAERLSAAWKLDPPLEHAGYLDLLGELPLVLAASRTLTPTSWAIIARHSARTTRGMASFVAQAGDGPLRLHDLTELRAYCYTVAGIVGEMLTELFLLGRQQLAGIAAELRADASAFGEGLQLVNILKDADADAEEGRRFLPANADRAGIFQLAFDGLDRASRYCARLDAAGAERGLVTSIALPIVLARATLQRVERLGPGAKLGRVHVAGLLARLHGAIAMGRLAELLSEKAPA